jgi:UDP-N-acetyl-alpha-D-quinovosamine dehydrogenase
MRKNMTTIKLVTGANGFVAKALCKSLLAQGRAVRGTVRDDARLLVDGVERYITGSINNDTDWRNALVDVDVIFHLASTVHRPDIQDSSVYQTSIPEATLALARQAALCGVKRFIFISTVSVYGVESYSGLISEYDELNPKTPYAASKLEAERALQQLAEHSNLEIVIIRPPLIYGSEANLRSNFTQLIRLVKRLPLLPFGCANNKRSFIGIDNFIAFLALCASHPQAVNQVFNISDDQDLSTKELCQMIAHLLQRKNMLLPLPLELMRVGLKFIGKEAIYNKLFESVRLDVFQAKTTLNWEPPFTVEQQFQRLFE